MVGKQAWLTQLELKELVRLDGCTISEMKSKIDRHPDTIRKWCKKYGIRIKASPPGRAKSNIFAEDVATVMELRESGLSFRDISGCFEAEPECSFDNSPQNLMVIVSRARKYGMDAYPSRHMTELVTSL